MHSCIQVDQRPANALYAPHLHAANQKEASKKKVGTIGRNHIKWPWTSLLSLFYFLPPSFHFQYLLSLGFALISLGIVGHGTFLFHEVVLREWQSVWKV